jgi:hypothetical protein
MPGDLLRLVRLKTVTRPAGPFGAHLSGSTRDNTRLEAAMGLVSSNDSCFDMAYPLTVHHNRPFHQMKSS